MFNNILKLSWYFIKVCIYFALQIWTPLRKVAPHWSRRCDVLKARRFLNGPQKVRVVIVICFDLSLSYANLGHVRLWQPLIGPLVLELYLILPTYLIGE